MDAEAPSFLEYLGDVGRMCIDMVAEKGEQIVASGGIQKYTIPCNWKFATGNVWDFYHSITHQSSRMAGWQRPNGKLLGIRDMYFRPNMAFLGEYGHVFGGPENSADNPTSQMRSQDWRKRPGSREAFGPLIDRIPVGHPHVFPNFWVTSPGLAQISLRLPKGPMQTEIWWFTFLDASTPETHKEQLRNAMHTFGPAGLLEQDDGENWGQSTRGMVGTVSSTRPLNYAMSLGHGEVIRDEMSPPRIESLSVTEHPQLWHYRAWSEWMAAETWDQLREMHSRIPDSV